MRVLVLDEGFMSGAFTALGLARAGCKVDVLAALGGRAECRTHDGRWWFGPRVGALGPTSFDSSRYDVVYAATEPLQAALGHPAASKPCVSAIVRAAGVETPDERAAESDDDVHRAVQELGLPIVVKGAHGRGGKYTFIARTLGDALGAARRQRAAGVGPFAQRYVPGPTCLVGGLFDHGRPLRLYAGKKVVQFPADTGPAAELVSVCDAPLFDAALRAFDAAKVTGLASADFVVNPGGGPEFLELNARPWGSISAAWEAGVDLFGPLVSQWRGENVAADLSFRHDVRCTVFPLALLTRSAPRALAAGIRRAWTAPIEPRLAAHIAHRLTRVALDW
jgi:hypothetical protein